MKRIALLIHENIYPSSIASVIDLLEGANWCLVQAGRSPAFELELVSENENNIQLDVPARFICCRTIGQVTHTDLIIIPGFSGDSQAIVNRSKAVIDWIKEMKGSGTEIASLCVGSFFLAEAGLLDGKMATSHWAAADEMQLRYPLIKVRSDRIITDQDGIYTGGGGFASLKLILYLIEKFCGRETVLRVSKWLSIDMAPTGQAHFAVFTGQHQHDDDEIRKSQAYIEQNYSTNISIDQVSALSNTGKRNFIRRFKAATNNTPIEYLQRVRVEAAKKALEDRTLQLHEVVNVTGYEDIKTFRMVFKKMTGLSPRDYRKKYAREPNAQ